MEFRPKAILIYSDAWKVRSAPGIGFVSQNPNRTRTGIPERWLCPAVL